ncbi:MAG: hypothetical protein INF12_14750 [Methylobacterium sp.]|nr:hypothetical protein [Methylobacterium sp.]
MKLEDKLPPDYVMREMARLANEAAVESMAAFAEQFARDPRMASVNGRDALMAFAAAARSTSKKVWPADQSQ